MMTLRFGLALLLSLLFVGLSGPAWARPASKQEAAAGTGASKARSAAKPAQARDSRARPAPSQRAAPAERGAAAVSARRAGARPAAARAERGAQRAADRSASRGSEGRAGSRVERAARGTEATRGRGMRAATASGRGLRVRSGAAALALAPAGLAAAEAPRLTEGQRLGLHAADDPLDLKSSVALVIDEETNEVLVSKNSQAVLPIASITKLMTALLVVEAGQPLEELITVTQEDVDTEKNSRSRLAVGTQLTRGEMLHLALMSSENRAAHALGRHYPGGMPAMVRAMNARGQALGMRATRFVEPTGLSSANQSSAEDLAVLVKAAHAVPLLREMSTSQEAQVAVGERILQFRNTNGLVNNPEWEIGLQKTGYIAEAGRCLVMQARLAGRKLILVLLDSAGRYSRLGDAERIRRWLLESPGSVVQVRSSLRPMR